MSRLVCALVVVLVGCRSGSPSSTGAGSGSGLGAGMASGSGADAGVGSGMEAGARPGTGSEADAGAGAASGSAADAGSRSGAPAPIDADTFVERESLGPLRWNMTEADVITALGAPATRTPPQYEGATGGHVSTWSWPGVSVEMAGDSAKGPWRVRLITVGQGRDFATRRGVRIGSTLDELQRAYPRSTEDTVEPNQYLVGSIYGGLLFTLKKAVVIEIAIGPFAF